jgi:two-component system chemotaxis response regulator CheY
VIQMTKILLIEDSIFERKAVSNMLKKNGYTEIVEACDGDQGLLKCGVENPDVVFLDLRMPGVDGLYVLDRLKEIRSDVKVVIMSIIRDKKTIDDCIARGACNYISKPVTEAKLLSVLNSIFN